VRLRPVHPEERQIAVLWGVAALAAILLRPFWLALAPFLPPCPFRALTGVPCPTCGTSHAALAMLDAHVLAALADNPLAAAAGLAFVVGGLIAPFWVLFRGPVPDLAAPPSRGLRATLVVLLLANWAWVIARS
jgi:hypothetical protein